MTPPALAMQSPVMLVRKHISYRRQGRLRNQRIKRVLHRLTHVNLHLRMFLSIFVHITTVQIYSSRHTAGGGHPQT